MPSLGFGELVLVLIIALVVFGPGKLPGVGRAVGSAMREFKSAKDGLINEMSETPEAPKTEKKEESEAASK